MAANIKKELADIDLGDKRRERRIMRLASRMAEAPSESLRASSGGCSEAIAAFRLFHSEDVTHGKILDAHRKPTLARAAKSPRLLFISDTTELDYSSHKALAEAGVSVMTVSYALRDHPEISPATRERVKAVAARMGFRPDPMLSALVAYRSDLAKPASHGALGMVTQIPVPQLQHTAYGRRVTASARKRAKQLGYELELFQVDPSLSRARATEILRSRGIDGLLVSPLSSPDTRLELGWEHFSAVAIGRSLASPKLDFVSANQYAAALQVHDVLRERGYRRIGFVACGGIDSRVQHRFMAGYTAREFELRGRLALPPLLENSEEATPLATWLKRYKPDAIISDGTPILSRLEQLGCRMPEDIGVALCVIGDTPHPCSGIHVAFDEIGARAVDFLHLKMLHDEKGIPQNPTGWIISGTWQEGETLRKA